MSIIIAVLFYFFANWAFDRRMTHLRAVAHAGTGNLPVCVYRLYSTQSGAVISDMHMVRLLIRLFVYF